MGNFSELVSEFGNASGLGDLALAQGSVCRLIFDGEVMLDLELDASGKVLLVAATVASSVEELGDDVFAVSMQLNANVTRSGGAYLAHDAEADDLLLIRRLDDTGMRYDEFETLLRGFIDYAAHCRLVVMETMEDDDDTADLDADDDDLDGDDPGNRARPNEMSSGRMNIASEEEVVFRL